MDSLLVLRLGGTLRTDWHHRIWLNRWREDGNASWIYEMLEYNTLRKEVKVILKIFASSLVVH